MLVYEKKIFIVDIRSDETHDDIRRYFVAKYRLKDMLIRNIWIYPVCAPVKIDERKPIVDRCRVVLEVYEAESNERS